MSETLAGRQDLEARLDEFWKLFLRAIAVDPDWPTMQRKVKQVRSALRRDVTKAKLNGTST